MILVNYVVSALPAFGVVLVCGIIAGVLIIARGSNKEEAMRDFTRKLEEWNDFDGKTYSAGKDISPDAPKEEYPYRQERWG
jgi:hypothetical protein